jgi:protein-tyrosine phosphatase
MRSRTGEEMYKNDPRFDVASAGTAWFAETRIDKQNLSWADIIVVMEEHHKKSIRKEFPRIAKEKKIIVLDIPDIYQFMDRTLMRDLKAKFEELYARETSR